MKSKIKLQFLYDEESSEYLDVDHYPSYKEGDTLILHLTGVSTVKWRILRIEHLFDYSKNMGMNIYLVEFDTQ